MSIKFNPIFCLLLFAYLSTSALSAGNFRVSGYVKDAQTNEVLIGAGVWETKTNNGVLTDNRGYFSLLLKDTSSLTFTYVGYQLLRLEITNPKDTFLTIQMEAGETLNEIVVSAVSANHFDVSRFSAKDLMLTPSLGAKPDVLKTLQLLPGVQSHSEGLSMILVRGGDAGQNHYLLDNVPLIYVNHLGGFTSVFNPDMINSVDFYKGNFPAKYGGKLSSIVEITQREGDVSKHQGSFSIGLTDASFSFEGPAFRSKGSYMITARKTLTELLMMGFTALSDGNNAIAGYGFHDINAKLTWKPDTKNSLQLNVYTGDDYLNYTLKWWAKFGNKNERNHIRQQWGNWLLSANWKRAFDGGWHVENILSFSHYRNINSLNYKNKTDKIYLENLDRASVQDFSWRSAVKYSPMKNWDMAFGGQASYLVHEPVYIYRSASNLPTQRNLFHTIETALYLDNKIKLTPRFLLQPSLRVNGYFNDDYRLPRFEPRLNIQFKASNNHYLNANYMSVSQNSHLVFTQSSILKKEIWLPATNNIPSQTSNQISLGWSGSYCQGMFGTELNLYYKKMENLAALKEGYENMTDITNIENKLATNGKGIAYGTEITLRKNTGWWTGSASYAYSKATRQFAEINGGQVYDYEYNRPHNITLNFNRQLSKAWTMNAVWLLQSGFLYTPAIGKQYAPDMETGLENNVELIYGDKNSARMPAYHRLDLGFSYTKQTKKGNNAVWTFSVYNLYNHQNPYNFYYDDDNDIDNTTDYAKPLSLYQTSFFPIIPSISYKIYFDYTKKEKKGQAEKKKKNWLYL